MRNKYDMKPVSGFTPEIGRLLMFLKASKDRIEDTVSDLSIEALDYAPDETHTTIGTLLKHIAAVEEWFRILTFEGRDFTEKERLFWHDAMPGPGKMLDRAIQGNDVASYRELWDAVRKRTLKEFKKQNDTWLYSKAKNQSSNNYFVWFHLMEDHLSHLGQIKTIKKRIPPM